MPKIFKSDAAFLGLAVGVLICGFYELQVIRTLGALWDVISTLF